MRFNPDSLSITPETLSLFAGLNELEGAWKPIGAPAPEHLSALRRSASRVERATVDDG